MYQSLFLLISYILQKAWQFLASAAEGLYLLHSRNIIHRDLKPENFFLGKNFTAKIGDLGIAIQLDSPEENITSRAGTPYSLYLFVFISISFCFFRLYFSPEIHLQQRLV